MIGSCCESERHEQWRETRGRPRWRGLRALGLAVLLAGFGLTAAGSADSADAVSRPAETADAALVGESFDAIVGQA